MLTGVNYKAVPKGTTAWIDAKLGSMRKPYDLTKRRLQDGSSAVALFQAICKKLNYSPEHYRSDAPPVPTTRFKCKFCGMDPPDHWGGDCPDNPQNKGVVTERSPQRRQSTNRVLEFASFVPWQFVLLGAVALLLGFLMESDAAQSDSIQLLTYG